MDARVAIDAPESTREMVDLPAERRVGGEGRLDYHTPYDGARDPVDLLPVPDNAM